MRTTKVWSISLPSNLGKQVEKAAKEEDRTRSELVREALRLYLGERKWSELQKETSAKARALGMVSERDVEKAVDEVRD